MEALQQPYVEALLSYTRIKRPQVRGPSGRLQPQGQGAANHQVARRPLLISAARPPPAGPAPLPAHADEAREPAHAELRALGAGLCPAAPGQEAAASALRDLGRARVKGGPLPALPPCLTAPPQQTAASPSSSRGYGAWTGHRPQPRGGPGGSLPPESSRRVQGLGAAPLTSPGALPAQLTPQDHHAVHLE